MPLRATPEHRAAQSGQEPTALERDVLAGLAKPQKELPCKYFYDERGSQLFERITELPEYYPTRTELAIMRQHVREMADRLGERCLLIEYGSGSSTKTRLLLAALREPAGYMPIDISAEHLLRSAAALAAEYPGLEVLPVSADYTQPIRLPSPRQPARRNVVYFPGSTIGNFDPAPAASFLRRMARIAGEAGGVLIGVDLKKDPWLLHDAYNDGQAVTAEFNLNLLVRLNRELGADFRPEQFRHYAFYNPSLGRIELHLVSLVKQTVRLAGVEVPFARGESIWTESSYKYTLDEFRELAAAAGLRVEQSWQDSAELFSVQYLTTA